MKSTRSKLTIITLLAILMAFFATTSCKDKSSSKNAGTSPLTATKSAEVVVSWPEPDSYASGIPVYNKFAALEPLFRFDNDTTYVVNFWATWCKPCIEELPYFEEFNTTSENKKVKVVLVSLDFPKKLESSLIPFVKKEKLKSKVLVLLDGKYNDWIDKVSPNWSGAIPATYIYRRNKSRLVDTPFENTQELSEIVKSFL